MPLEYACWFEVRLHLWISTFLLKFQIKSYTLYVTLQEKKGNPPIWHSSFLKSATWLVKQCLPSDSGCLCPGYWILCMWDSHFPSSFRVKDQLCCNLCFHNKHLPLIQKCYRNRIQHNSMEFRSKQLYHQILDFRIPAPFTM